MSLLVVGHEATATPMIWAIHPLGTQSGLRAEIHPAFSSSLPATTTYDQISSLNYLTRHVGGALPVFSCWCDPACGDGALIPKDTSTLLSPLLVR